MMVTTLAARIQNLKVHFKIRRSMSPFKPAQVLRAVDGISLEIREGEILGLVGESGCGKSTLGRAILRLIPATGGSVEINGKDFLALDPKSLQAARPMVQMIFQDPYASLDPRMTIFETLAEPLRTHTKLSAAALRKKIEETMESVGLPRKVINRYPHEFSGGQRQRIAIARALILDPKILIADEPTSSLDVSVQAQILNLLKQIQKERNLSLVFISHNLAVVRYLCDRVAVMYLGKIVETGTGQAIFAKPQHPYTQALIAAVPIPDPARYRLGEKRVVRGELPSPLNPPTGCAFNTRCPLATDQCRREAPKLEAKSDEASHLVSCWEVK